MKNKHIDKIISSKRTNDKVKIWLKYNYNEITELINLFPDIKNKELTRIIRMIENNRSVNDMSIMLYIFRAQPPKINSYEYVSVIYGNKYANKKFNKKDNTEMYHYSLLCRSLFQNTIKNKLNPFFNIKLNYKHLGLMFDIKIDNWLIDVVNEKFLNVDKVNELIEFKIKLCKNSNIKYLPLFDKQWKWNQGEVLKVILENVNEKN